MPTHPQEDRPSRRRLLVLAAAAVAGPALAGCGRREEAEAARPASQPAAPTTSAAPPDVVDAGPLDRFAADGVSADHADDGFFVVRRGGEVYALSTVCPHKGCDVEARPDGSFECPCHHSLFAPDGAVTKGPAKTGLPRLAVKLDAARHVLVDRNRTV